MSPDQPRLPGEPEEPEELMVEFRGTTEGVTARFARPEAAIIRDLVSQVVELIVADMPPPDGDELAAMVGMSENTSVPEDPVLARLLPDGYTGDPEAAQEFRRFTESGLRSAKVGSARTLLETLPARGGKVVLSVDQAEAWLRSLNDVRLALGVRLGVTDDFDGLADDVEPDDPGYAYIHLYQWLAYLQESLVAALS